VCGVVAIFKIGQFMAHPQNEKAAQAAAWLILAAMVFDALDGFVARLTRTASSFGAQLDSLCDLITFGVAPGFLTYAITVPTVTDYWARPVQAVCVLYSMCALIRLARFTVETAPDESAHREFAGLPSPAAAGVMASAVLPAVTLNDLVPTLADMIRHALPGLALATGILMVSRVKYAHVVNRVLKGRRPFIALVELALVIALFFLFKEFAFFIAFFGYTVTGPLFWVKKRLFRKPVIAGQAPEERHDNLF
jgi:CDP-diacylglycerol--serine O-phosphatidyltransferase